MHDVAPVVPGILFGSDNLVRRAVLIDGRAGELSCVLEGIIHLILALRLGGSYFFICNILLAARGDFFGRSLLLCCIHEVYRFLASYPAVQEVGWWGWAASWFHGYMY